MKPFGHLRRSGTGIAHLSVVGQHYHLEEEVVGYYTTGDRIKAWGTSGAFWGGLWSLLFGSAMFIVPGIGPLLAAGPVVGWIVEALLIVDGAQADVDRARDSLTDTTHRFLHTHARRA